MQTATENASPIATLDTAPEWIRSDLACYFIGGGVPVSKRTLTRMIGRGLRASKPSHGVLLVNRDSLRSFLERAAR